MNSHRKKVLLLALGLDILLGDPPNYFHPVAWMGKLIAVGKESLFLKRFRPKDHAFAELAFGAGIALGGSALVAGIASLPGKILTKPGCTRYEKQLYGLVEAVLLKSTISLRGLNNAAKEVQESLENDDLPAARHSLSWHLVSRGTSTLDERQISAAAIESVAENASDGILAPMFFYLLGGLPLALVYRFINTADSMLGYHTPDLEWLGKAAACLDDLLNFLPARLTGISILLSAPFVGGDASHVWSVMWRDARKTQSPNAGYPMSAMAGALNVELEKVGHYCLGIGGRKPGSADIQHSRCAMFLSILIASIGFIIFPFWTYIHDPHLRSIHQGAKK